MIIIPTYNERKNITVITGRIRAVLPEVPILFVDDNSPDGTSEEILLLQTTDKNIYLLKRPTKAGFASAYLDGFRFVFEKFNPEWVITMDADLSHPPEKLPELIEIVKSGKIAVGSRYISGGAIKNWKLYRRILSRVGNFYARIMTKLPIKDLTGGFITMPSSILKQLDLSTIKSRGYAFLMEIKVRLKELGGEIVEVSIIFEERREGESKIGRNIILEGIRYPARVFMERQIKLNYPAWLIFFISFLTYALTLPKTIFLGDSPEFMATAITLGIPHPPGYPGYVLFAKLFTFLPFGSLEYRVGLFSVVSASLCLVVFYFLFLKISKQRFVAFITALILAFSNMFWSQAIMAKIYVPFLLITLVILLLITKFWETNKNKYWVLSVFLFGLGLGFHQIMILFLPLFFLLVFRQFKFKTLIPSVFLFILGASFYLYLPIRANMDGNFYDFSNFYNTNKPGESFEGFKNYVLRADYSDYSGKFVLKDKLTFLGSAFGYIWEQFYWLLLLLPIGLWLISRNKFLLIATGGIFVLNILGIILLRTATFGYENDVFYSYYYLPSFSMIALWLGLGLSKLPMKRTVGLLLIVPILLFSKNYKINQLHNFDFTEKYTSEILKSLPDNAVLLMHFAGANTDTIGFSLHYQQTVKNLRPDVSVLTVYDVRPAENVKVLASIYGLNDPKNARYYLVENVLMMDEYKNRPFYTTFLANNSKQPTWTSISNGLIYKFSQKEPVDNQNYYSVEYEKDLAILESNMFGLDLLAQYFYTQAAYWATQKNLSKSQENFIQAIKYDYKVMGEDQKSFMEYRSQIFSN